MSILRAVSTALLCFFFAGAALANGYVEEWRVLGPAQTYHSNTQTAQLRSNGSSLQCRAGTYIPPGQSAHDGEAIGIPSQVCPYDLSDVQIDGCHSINWTGAPVLVCNLTTSETKRRYTSTDPAAGVQYARRFDDHVAKVFAMAVRDSNGLGSAMVGAAYQWPLLSAGTVTVDGGFGASLWYRSVVNTDTNELRRTFVPFIFPTLSFTESTTGLGFDVAAVPRVSASYKGQHYSIPTTVSVQLTWLIHSSDAGQSSLSLEPGAAGGFTAHYLITF